MRLGLVRCSSGGVSRWGTGWIRAVEGVTESVVDWSGESAPQGNASAAPQLCRRVCKLQKI